jgi:hypothetical protein
MRPKCIAKLSVRIPEELKADVRAAAIRRCCSDDEVVRCALENEFTRMILYRTNYYTDIRPIMAAQEEACRTSV